MPPVRVLVVAPAPVGDDRIGGIANFIRGFVRAAPEDFAIEIVGPDLADEVAGEGWQDRMVAGRKVRFLPVVRQRNARRTGRIPIKARTVLNMLVHRRQIATKGRVVQIHAPAMDWAFAGRDVPVVRVVHNAAADLATTDGESLWRRLGSILTRIENRSYARAAALFFVNAAGYEEYAAHADVKPRAQFLPNFFDETVFRRAPAADRRKLRADLARSLALDADRPWVLFAGRLDQQKNPVLAVETLIELRSSAGRASESMLLICGEGRLKETVQALVEQKGVSDSVRFLDSCPQPLLAQLMQASEALLVTSVFEAGPTVMYEALGAGLPVVSTPVGQAAQVIRSGETGWLTSASSATELAHGIEWALGQDRDELAGACSASVEAFTVAKVLDPFYEAHRRLAAERSAQ